MATTKFPKFSQGLANDPTTRRIWFGIATAHDFESHDGMKRARKRAQRHPDNFRSR
jgi:photosystem I P700 chlorophyll a apoprotein A2